MSVNIPSGSRSKVATPPKLLFVFLFVAFCLIAGLGAWAYHSQRLVLQQQAQNSLKSIAELKVAQIVEWRRQRLTDALVLSESPFFSKTVAEWLATPNSTNEAFLLTRFNSLRNLCHYGDVFIVDTNFQIRLSLSGAKGALHAELTGSVIHAMRERHAVLSDLHAGDKGDSPHLGIIAPIMDSVKGDPAARVAGLVVLREDATQFLYPMIQSWPVPSDSAETLLVRRDGDDVIYLNELRHQSNTALKLRFPLTRSDLPLVTALKGKQGVVRSRDYRGVKVVSVLKPVPGSAWFMVAKVDEDEVLAGWHQQSVLILGLILGCLLFAGSVAAVLWQRNEKRHYLARLKLEQDRRTSEIIFRKMFESMSELAVLHELVVDGNGRVVDYRILDCNPTFCRVTGIAREAAVGELATKVYGGEAPFLGAYTKVAQTGESLSLDAYFEPMGKWFSISAVCPQPGRFATIALDITDRKVAEQERERLNTSLREKNEELEALLYAASHDLRSPLVNIEGFGKRLEKACLELGEMLKHPALPEELRARAKVLVEDRIATALRYSHSGVAKMSNLINGLLVLSRLGRASLAITAVDMDRLMEQTLDAMRFQIQQASARVIVDPLPGCLGDAGFLGQVFSNLLDNAIKYRDSGRVLEIRISGMVIGDEAIYKVADTGVGIDPASQVKIWELFHRLNPDGPVQGEGLGLNLVMRMVRMQRGRVWVESEPGRGSRFFVALPKVEV